MTMTVEMKQPLQMKGMRSSEGKRRGRQVDKLTSYRYVTVSSGIVGAGSPSDMSDVWDVSDAAGEDCE